jgi:hypothetical protein
VLLGLTEAGRAQQRSTGRAHALNVARTMTSAYDDDELRQLMALCRKLTVERDAAIARAER